MTKTMNYNGLLERLLISFVMTLMSAVMILLLMAVNGDQKLKLLEETLIHKETFLGWERIPVKEGIKHYIDTLPIPKQEVLDETEEVVLEEVSEEKTTEEVGAVTISTDVDAEQEIWFLAKGIHGEASIGDREEKYKVGTVIMNRVQSNEYSNTVEKVLAEPRQYSSYQDSRWYTEEPSEETFEIARDIYLNGTRAFGPEVIFQSKTCEGICVDKTPWHEYGVKKVE